VDRVLNQRKNCCGTREPVNFSRRFFLQRRKTMKVIIECDLETDEIKLHVGNATIWADLSDYLDELLQDIMLDSGVSDKDFSDYMIRVSKSDDEIIDGRFKDLGIITGLTQELLDKEGEEADKEAEETDANGNTKGFRDIVDGEITVLS
jgi:hypothetical protein